MLANKYFQSQTQLCCCNLLTKTLISFQPTSRAHNSVSAMSASCKPYVFSMSLFSFDVSFCDVCFSSCCLPSMCFFFSIGFFRRGFFSDVFLLDLLFFDVLSSGVQSSRFVDFSTCSSFQDCMCCKPLMILTGAKTPTAYRGTPDRPTHQDFFALSP